MAWKCPKRKLVVVADFGSLPELGGISGPILGPTQITMEAIRKMIVNGRTVLECDPADPRNEKKRIKLDSTNVSEQNFGKFESVVQDELDRINKLIEESEKAGTILKASGEQSNSTDNMSVENGFRSNEREAQEEGYASGSEIEGKTPSDTPEIREQNDTEPDVNDGTGNIPDSDVQRDKMVMPVQQNQSDGKSKKNKNR